MGDILRKIKTLRRKLDTAIKKYGLNSNETREISKEIDKLIKEYYDNNKIIEYPKNSEMIMYYNQSYKALKIMTLQLKRFPAVQEWNDFAKKNNCLSHLSLEYMSKLNWKYLKIKVERELNIRI